MIARSLVLFPLALVVACSTATQSGRGSTPVGSDPPVAAARTMTMVVRFEVSNLSMRIPGAGQPLVTKRLFHAGLAVIDAVGVPHPYLAEELPTLNTDSWRVLPDGHMQTTYRLRPGLAWQDGELLTADDFVFGYRV